MIPLGFLDPLRLIVWAYRERASLTATDIPGRCELVLVKENWQHPQINKVPALRAGITRARRLSEQNGFRMIRAELEVLAPHTALPWTMGQPDEAIVNLSLYTNPGCALIEGVMTPLAPGQVCIMGGSKMLRTAVNGGDTDRAHLVLYLRREAEE